MRLTYECILEATKHSVHAAGKKFGHITPAGALVFSCNARKGILGTRAIQELHITSEQFHNTPVWGLYGFSEFSPLQKGLSCHLHHMTMITLLIGEKGVERSPTSTSPIVPSRAPTNMV